MSKWSPNGPWPKMQYTHLSTWTIACITDTLQGHEASQEQWQPDSFHFLFLPHCFIVWTQTAVPLFTVFRLMATQGPVMVLTWVKLQDMFWGVNYSGRFPESSVETHQPPWCLWSVLSYSVKASYVLWDLVSPLSVDEPFNTHVLLEFFCDVK